MSKDVEKAAAEVEPGSRADNLLVRWRATDTPMGVTRETVRKLSAHFGISDTALIHLALRGLANEVWPIAELDASSAELDRQFLEQQRTSAVPSKKKAATA